MHSKSLAYEKYGLENMTEHVEFSLKFTRVYVCVNHHHSGVYPTLDYLLPIISCYSLLYGSLT